MTLFLSYTHADRPVVDPFVAELRRRGVRLWRDIESLPAGQRFDEEIAEAARRASGFVFVLSKQAAASEWVRERERRWALERRARRSAVRIFPVFLDPPAEVFEAMRAQGAEPDPEVYGQLGAFRGAVIDAERPAVGWREAARKVLAITLDLAAMRRAPEAPIRIGLATRDGASRLCDGLGDADLDLLLDWAEEYPTDELAERASPSHDVYRQDLLPALQDVASAVSKAAGRAAVRFVPQCHLSMALAVGMAFRSHLGLDVEVVETRSEDVWLGPRRPLVGEPERKRWALEQPPVPTGGPGLVVAVNLTRPRRDFEQVEGFAMARRWAGMVYARPADGPSHQCLAGFDGTTAVAQLAADLVAGLQSAQPYTGRDPIHLFLAAPPGFALLLGRQLANLSEVQTYEHRSGRGTYEPAFRLASS